MIVLYLPFNHHCYHLIHVYPYIIESIDSINRGEGGFPLMQYITNGGISVKKWT